MKKSVERLLSFLIVMCLLTTVLPHLTVNAVSDLSDSKAAPAEISIAENLITEPEQTTQLIEAHSQLLRYVDQKAFSEMKHIQRLTEEEDLSTYVFLNQDGSRTVYYMDEPVKYLDPGGVVREKT